MENLRWHPKRGVFSGKVDGDREATPEEIAVHYKQFELSPDQRKSELTSWYASELNRLARGKLILELEGRDTTDLKARLEELKQDYEARKIEIEAAS